MIEPGSALHIAWGFQSTCVQVWMQTAGNQAWPRIMLKHYPRCPPVKWTALHSWAALLHCSLQCTIQSLLQCLQCLLFTAVQFSHSDARWPLLKPAHWGETPNCLYHLTLISYISDMAQLSLGFLFRMFGAVFTLDICWLCEELFTKACVTNSLHPTTLSIFTPNATVWQLGMAMRVREKAPTANICTYMCEYHIYAPICGCVHRKKVAHCHP